eukprot:NODE_3884_length_1967_cov_7.347283.p1 GENE.NODE_3884_length_1967_cov_7.347283~~NODE_3884_length_1967_cov_7.347283.p1  ORF type:complete len:542 (+),score=214.85 NODE_3884_length_1967_cov_7.347283:80-1705(+)
MCIRDRPMAESEPAPEGATPADVAAAVAVLGAGGTVVAEDFDVSAGVAVPVDESSLELNVQEQVFQKCFRRRVDRVADSRQRKVEKKVADEKKRAQALEDAFDNEVDKIVAFIDAGNPIDTEDAYGTTLLSEAAAGGAIECITMLLAEGADPNRRGRNRRTPLWRAANAGQADAVRLLLRGGCDPRIRDDSACRPYDSATGVETKALLECWDTSVTEKLVQVRAQDQKRKATEQLQKQQRQGDEMKGALMELERRARIVGGEVARLETLVVEYREQLADYASSDPVKMAELQPMLEAAVVKLGTARQMYNEQTWQSRRAQLKVTDFEVKLQRSRRKAGDLPCVEPDKTITITAIIDVILKDVGGVRRKDGRWPLIFDPSGKAACFFGYTGAIVIQASLLSIQCLSEVLEEKQRFLKAFMTHLMYGGAIFIHLGKDFETGLALVEAALNTIEPGLLGILLDRSVLYSYLLPRRFLSLVPPNLQGEIDPLMFDSDERLAKFLLGFIVEAPLPEELEVFERSCRAFYTIRVYDPETEGAEAAAA